MGKSSEEKREFRSRDRWLVFAFLLGPMAVLTHLTVSYSLVPSSCAEGSKTMLHATTAAFLPLCLIAAAIAWTILRRCSGAAGFSPPGTREESPQYVGGLKPAAPPQAEELWRQRTRWLATVTVVLAIFSAIVILAMEIPNVILRSCD